MDVEVTGPDSANMSMSEAEMKQAEENQILLAGTLIFFHFLGFLYIAMPKLYDMLKPASSRNEDSDLLLDDDEEESDEEDNSESSLGEPEDQ